jgi:hypothetical protein
MSAVGDAERESEDPHAVYEKFDSMLHGKRKREEVFAISFIRKHAFSLYLFLLSVI